MKIHLKPNKTCKIKSKDGNLYVEDCDGNIAYLAFGPDEIMDFSRHIDNFTRSSFQRYAVNFANKNDYYLKV